MKNRCLTDLKATLEGKKRKKQNQNKLVLAHRATIIKDNLIHTHQI